MGACVGRAQATADLPPSSSPPPALPRHFSIPPDTVRCVRRAQVCFRTLDVYTSAVLEACMDPPRAPKPEWREMMSKLSAISCSEYRGIVFQNPDFVPYFHTATPVSELGGLNIGSRPAKRKPGGGVGTLRAIPWIFAWTQTRLHLPVWLGIGEALEKAFEESGEDVLSDMYDNWPFFQVRVPGLPGATLISALLHTQSHTTLAPLPFLRCLLFSEHCSLPLCTARWQAHGHVPWLVHTPPTQCHGSCTPHPHSTMARAHPTHTVCMPAATAETRRPTFAPPAV
eukprot:364100-Chlamydomonas_euryale.AAC.66